MIHLDAFMISIVSNPQCYIRVKHVTRHVSLRYFVAGIAGIILAMLAVSIGLLAERVWSRVTHR